MSWYVLQVGFPVEVDSETELSVREIYSGCPWGQGWGSRGREAGPSRGRRSWEAGSVPAVADPVGRSGAGMAWVGVRWPGLCPPASSPPWKVCDLGWGPVGWRGSWGHTSYLDLGGSWCLYVHHIIIILFEKFTNPIYPETEDCFFKTERHRNHSLSLNWWVITWTPYIASPERKYGAIYLPCPLGKLPGEDEIFHPVLTGGIVKNALDLIFICHVLKPEFTVGF